MRCSPFLLAIKTFLLDSHYPNCRPKGFCLFSTLDKIRFIHPPHLQEMCTSDHLQCVFSLMLIVHKYLCVSTLCYQQAWSFYDGLRKDEYTLSLLLCLPALWGSHIYISICPARLLTSAGQTLQPSSNFKKCLRSFIGGSALRYSLCQ